MAAAERQVDERTPTPSRRSQTLPQAGIGTPSTQLCNPALSIFLGCQKQEPDSSPGFHHCSGVLFKVLVVSNVYQSLEQKQTWVYPVYLPFMVSFKLGIPLTRKILLFPRTCRYHQVKVSFRVKQLKQLQIPGGKRKLVGQEETSKAEGKAQEERRALGFRSAVPEVNLKALD